MGRKYTRTETIAQIEEVAKDMSTFYTATCINHAGTTYKADGARYYTEIISEYLLEHYDLFDQIQKSNVGTTKLARITEQRLAKLLTERKNESHWL